MAKGSLGAKASRLADRVGTPLGNGLLRQKDHQYRVKDTPDINGPPMCRGRVNVLTAGNSADIIFDTIGGPIFHIGKAVLKIE